MIVSAAKMIGRGAGKVAALAGVKSNIHEAAVHVRKGKVPKKHKHRLPRRQKKAQQASKLKE